MVRDLIIVRLMNSVWVIDFFVFGWWVSDFRVWVMILFMVMVGKMMLMVMVIVVVMVEIRIN